MLMTPTRQELLQNYDYIDKVSLVQSMSDAHIRVLRDDIGDQWKVFIARLGLEEKEVRLIDLQEQREAMKRHAALHKWKMKFGRRATYLSFLNACMQVQDVALAERMLDLLNEHMKDLAASNSARGASLNTPSGSHHDRSYHDRSYHDRSYHDRSYHDRSPKHTDKEGEHDVMSLSYTSISSRGSTESGIGDWVPIEQRVEELKMKYKYTIDVFTEYFEKNVTPPTIAKRLLLMPQELKQVTSYVKVKNSDSEKALSQLLEVSDYWQSEVLQQLVGDVGDESCKRAMALYQDNLHCFNSDTALGEFTKDWLDREANSEQRQLTLKMGARWETRTLQDLEELRKKLQRKARFNTHDLQLSRVQSAGVQVTFTLASDNADISNLKSVECEFYKASSILRLSAGESVIYDVESPKHYEFINAPSTHLMCPITQQIMLDPQKTQCCNKHLTREAIEHRQSNGEPCPFCYSTTIEFRADPLLQGKARGTKIHCPYKHEGCHWEGEIRYLSTHLHSEENSCHYKLLDCSYSCGASIQRHSRDKHLEICSVFNRPLKCLHCGLEYPRTKAHDEICPKLPVCCPYQCGEWVERSEAKRHLRVCNKLQTKPRKAVEQIDSGDLDGAFQEHVPSELTAAKDDPNFRPTGYKLLSIAKKMLTLRSRLPDVRLSLLEAKIQLKQMEIDQQQCEATAAEQQEAEIEQKHAGLRAEEAELQNEEELIEREMTALRYELHQSHRDTRITCTL